MNDQKRGSNGQFQKSTTKEATERRENSRKDIIAELNPHTREKYNAYLSIYEVLSDKEVIANIKHYLSNSPEPVSHFVAVAKLLLTNDGEPLPDVNNLIKEKKAGESKTHAQKQQEEKQQEEKTKEQQQKEFKLFIDEQWRTLTPDTKKEVKELNSTQNIFVNITRLVNDKAWLPDMPKDLGYKMERLRRDLEREHGTNKTFEHVLLKLLEVPV